MVVSLAFSFTDTALEQLQRHLYDARFVDQGDEVAQIRTRLQRIKLELER